MGIIIKRGAKMLALGIRAVILDVDGVLTDNTVMEGILNPAETGKPKFRSHYDGQGISFLRGIGIHVACITNEQGDHASAIAELVKKWNRLPSSKAEKGPDGWPDVALFKDCGGEKKTRAAEEFLKGIGVGMAQAAFMGDDVVDWDLMQKAGLRAAPSSSELCIRRIAHFVSERPGGKGAVRDFANWILECRGIDQTKLPTG